MHAAVTAAILMAFNAVFIFIFKEASKVQGPSLEHTRKPRRAQFPPRRAQKSAQSETETCRHQIKARSVG